MAYSVVLGALAAAVSAGLTVADPGFLSYSSFAGAPYAVTYDNRSLFLNGQRSMFLSAGFHYPRFTPAQWDDIFVKAQNDGFNMIQTYVFWNAHQAKPESWDFNYHKNLTLFLDKAAQYGFFVNFRIGPYVCAEWNYGGYPAYLNNIPDMQTREANLPWEQEAGGFFLRIVDQYRSYFADSGGPIVLAQVENELPNGDPNYLNWCSQLVNDTLTHIPWEMCNGHSAVNTINSCNGGDCTGFIDGHGQNGRVLIDQPALWTENWIDWFQSWGDGSPAWQQDFTGEATSKAQGLLKWFARGGSHYNWYMYAGGNHFGSNAGSSMANYYYWGSPLNSDNLANVPVRSHLKNLNNVVKAVSGVVINAAAQSGKEVQVPYYFTNGTNGIQTPNSLHIVYSYSFQGSTVAFLENDENRATVVMVFNGLNYTVPSQSVSVVATNGSVIFNSATISPVTGHRNWTDYYPAGSLTWQQYVDPAIPATPAAIPAPSPARPTWTGSALGYVAVNQQPMEHINFTEYDSEFMPYTTTLSSSFLQAMADKVSLARPGSDLRTSLSAVPLLLNTSHAQAFDIFVDGQLVGNGFEVSHSGGAYKMNISVDMTSAFTFSADGSEAKPKKAAAGSVLTMLSYSLGIDNYGTGVDNNGNFYSSGSYKGIQPYSSGNAVVLAGADLTNNGWTMQAGLSGEAGQVYSAGFGNVTWTPASASTGPVSWIATHFQSPPAATMAQMLPGNGEVTITLNLNVEGLGRGTIYLNGFNLGRYWSKRCGGDMCQRYYSLPADLLSPAGQTNLLVLFDDLGTTNVNAATLAYSTIAQ